MREQVHLECIEVTHTGETQTTLPGLHHMCGQIPCAKTAAGMCQCLRIKSAW